jgi:hypothetical protein
MRLAEHEREGKVEDCLAVAAADVQHPALVLGAGRQDHRAHDLGGAVARASVRFDTAVPRRSNMMPSVLEQ